MTTQPDIAARELEIKKQVIEETNVSFSSLVPTNDIEVKTVLRRLGHPICYFGETAMHRRQRLAKILLMIQEEKNTEILDWKGIIGAREENEITQEENEEESGEFFVTEGPEELKYWRKYLWNFSRERATKRLKREYEERKSFLQKMKVQEEFSAAVQDGIYQRRCLISNIKNIQLHASQVPQKRPLSSIAMRASGLQLMKDIDVARLMEGNEMIDAADNSMKDVNNTDEINESNKSQNPVLNKNVDTNLMQSGIVLTGGYDGDLRIWSLNSKLNYKLLKEFPSGEYIDENGVSFESGHEERITGVAFNPIEDIGETTIAFASGSVDRTAKIWSLNSRQPLGTLKGHSDRLGRVSFHPCGGLLGTSSYDGTWRLWDLERQMCLLEQEGHSRGVYDIQFHPDGSLSASCDLGGIVRLWDLRSGSSLLHIGSHVRKILSLAFAPNGIQFATGSDDNTIKIWDLRMRRFVYRIPAHERLVSRVRFDQSGRFLVSSSYDKTIRVWANGEYKLVKKFEGHSGPITDFDLVNTDILGDDSFQLVSCGLDKTWKVYQKM